MKYIFPLFLLMAAEANADTIGGGMMLENAISTTQANVWNMAVSGSIYLPMPPVSGSLVAGSNAGRVIYASGTSVDSAGNLIAVNVNVTGNILSSGTVAGAQVKLPVVPSGGNPAACTATNDGAQVVTSLGITCTCRNGSYVTGKASLVTGVLGAVACTF